MKFDVIVIGGGTAGVVAAIQAGRAGAKTLLVEKNGMPGGTMTIGGVNFPGLFHADSQQIIRGIGWELVTKSVIMANDNLPDFSTQGQEDTKKEHWRYQINVNILSYTHVADQALMNAGVKVLFHAMLAFLEWDKSKFCWTVGVCTKTGIQKYSAKVIIDCTADANAASIYGLETEIDTDRQPSTLVTRLVGYEQNGFDQDKVSAAFRKAVSCGELLASDAGWNGSGLSFLWNNGGNTIHINSCDTSLSEGKTMAEMAGRAAVSRLVAFYRRQKGLENIRVEYLSSEMGVRESRRIIGDKRITVEEYENGKSWKDSVSYSYYPIDVHTSHGLIYRPLGKNIRPTIPLRSLLVKGATNLIAAGRHICGDKYASSAFRVQASCMAMGQAAGAAGAIAAAKNCDIREVNILAIKDMLKKHDSIVP